MHGLFPLSAYSPHGDAQTGTKSGGEHPQEHAKTTTQNRTNTPKSLTAQTEPRYYGQVPIRGCSLMVKPQSSKLITRVRFPSSPRTNPSDVVGGIFCARGCRESLPGENTFPRTLGIFTLQPVIPSRTSLQDSLTHADLFPRALGIRTLPLVIPSIIPLDNAESPREDSRGLLTFLFLQLSF